MGKAISGVLLRHTNAAMYAQLLHDETHVLQQWVMSGTLSETPKEMGFELECWLIDKDMRPVSGNLELLDALHDAHFVPEIADCTLEINTDPLLLQGHALAQHDARLQAWLNSLTQKANRCGKQVVFSGTWPLSKAHDFTTPHITPLGRYHALQRHILAHKAQRRFTIYIKGKEDTLQFQTHSVGIGALACATHVHLRVGFSQSARYYNAAQAISAPVLAVSGNSPFLLGKSLWAESRIALLEQLFIMPNVQCPHYTSRAFFGKKYLTHSMLELFIENDKKIDALLPLHMDAPTAHMRHLQLQNSTIYRWNRPVMAFDEEQIPHFRIEHRALPAGPTVKDMIANTAFWLGLLEYFAQAANPLENQLPFRHAKRNFYKAATSGLHTALIWTDARLVNACELILEQLLPRAYEGLQSLNLHPGDIDAYLSIIKARVQTQQTGSQWQWDCLKRHQGDYRLLAEAYLANQLTERPVHEWGLTARKGET